MTSEKLRLQIRLEPQELTEWATLAKHCGVSRQMLGAQAVRQLARSMRGATAPVRPLLSPAKQKTFGAGEAIFLGADDATELAFAAARYDASLEQAAVAAVRFLLADARAGIAPMVRPMADSGIVADPTWYNVENAADNNYNKALQILDVLVSMIDKGLTTEKIADLRWLESKETSKPSRRPMKY